MVLALLAHLGCSAPDDPRASMPTGPDAAASGATGLPRHTGTEGDTGLVDGCPVVRSVNVAPTGQSTLAVLEVEVSTDATVVAWCYPDDDPDDVLFVESSLGGTRHALRLRGLAGDVSSTCHAAALCDDGPPHAPATATFARRAITQGLGPLTLTDGALPPEGQVLLSAVSPTGFALTELVAYGPRGRPRWWYRLPAGVQMFVEARYHPDDDWLVWGGGMTLAGRPQQVDPWDGPLWTFWGPEPGTIFHHDGKQLADGRVLTLESITHFPTEPEALPFEGYRVRGVDPADNSFFLDIDSHAALDAGWLQPVDKSLDPWHANWMDLVQGPGSTGPDDPELLLSLCYDWSVLAVDPTDGSPRWILRRGEGWDVRDADGFELGDEGLPRCTHGLEVDGPRVLLYDNGQTTSQSTAEEWLVDPVTKTATRTWQWTEPAWQEDFLGDVDWLGDDRVVVTQARLAGVPHVLEVDRASGEVVRRWDFAGNGRLYRAELLPSCTFLPQLTSACPDTAHRYAEVRALWAPTSEGG